MDYIYSAMLLHRNGKEINEDNLKRVLESAGIKPDNAKVKALVAALDGVDIDKEIREASMIHVAPAEVKAVKAVKEEKKEEEKKSEESAAAGLSSLFG